MKPKRIILIRHGESQANINREVYLTVPDHKIPLTNNGIEQASTAGLKLQQELGGESVHYYVSPHLRSRQTYHNISKHIPGRMFEDPRLREQEWGHFRTPDETKALEDIRDRYGPFHYRFPGGESGADVYDRASAFIETLHRDFQDEDYPQNTILVTHGLTIRLFLMRWFHSSVEDFESWKNPKNCQRFIMNKDIFNDSYLFPAGLAVEPKPWESDPEIDFGGNK